MIVSKLLALCVLSSIASSSTAERRPRRRSGGSSNDKVTSVPGYNGDDLCWDHYAGYLAASEDHQLFYWYHEATTSPSEKPLVLWLNGGPGCSSLGGMFTELGPFVLDTNLNVMLNPFSFNVAANLLFIEQPAGVGFSYPNGPADDSSTAIDTVLALRNFLTLHPELADRPLYVMGESYGGHYVPNTVKEIQRSNQGLAPFDRTTTTSTNSTTEARMTMTRINIQGFAVGNGYTDWKLDFNANVENGRYHALTSQALWETAQKTCEGDYARCFWPRDDVDCPEDCGNAVAAATVHAMDGSIDIYDIYEDVCLHDDQARLETQLTTFLGHRKEALLRYYNTNINNSSSRSNNPQENNNTTALTTTTSRRALRTAISPVFPTCIDDFTERYLNSPEVQTAIHVRPDTIPNGHWTDCGNVDYDFNYESELENYKEWTQKGDLNILIYNGDTDYILSHMGNSAWINQGLQLPQDREWSPWKGSDGQVAGYFETYQTGEIPLTFLTVKGAGHMVPKDRPRHALDMLVQFLKGAQTYDEVGRAESGPLCPST